MTTPRSVTGKRGKQVLVGYGRKWPEKSGGGSSTKKRETVILE